METPTNQWDTYLVEYCTKQSRIYGFSGDALAVWVAEWIKYLYQD